MHVGYRSDQWYVKFYWGAALYDAWYHVLRSIVMNG